MQLVFLFNFHIPAIAILQDSVKHARNFEKTNSKSTLPSFENIRFENISFSYSANDSSQVLKKYKF